MSNINYDLDRDRQLTKVNISGKVTVDQITSFLENYYTQDPTLLLLWDFSEADVSELSSEALRTILSVASKYIELRKKGKTALVLPSDYAFGMGRMYESFAEVYEHPAEHRAFRTAEEAMRWLFDNDDPLAK